VKTAPRKAGRGAGFWIGTALAVAAVGATGWYVAQQSQGRKDDDARARAGAEAELAKARAEAEEARKAAAAATTSAEAAKRALEEQRIANTRTRAQAELAAARAEAEATRRKADAELASAAEARRAAEAAAKARATEKPAAPAAAAAATSPKAAPARVSKWVGIFACGPVGSTWPSTFMAPVTQAGNAFALAMGKAGQPGVLQMKGVRQPDGSLQLAGSGISPLKDFHGENYKASFIGKFSEGSYYGRGTLGTRDCALSIVTEAEAARRAVEFPGPWVATFACAAQESVAPTTYQAAITVTGQKYELRYGTAGVPGSATMSGTREADGRMRVTGRGISRMTEFYGQPFTLDFDGKFSGERYSARGKSGARDCVLSIARR
jgi:hypothetical protein